MRLFQYVRLPGRSSGRRPAFWVVLLLMATICIVPGLSAQKAAKSGRPVIFTVTPEYPETLQHAKIGGVVRLSVTVLASGTVAKVQIRGGNPILAESAVAAVTKWKYAPGPVETNEEISLSFSPH
jgi:TonB family protein